MPAPTISRPAQAQAPVGRSSAPAPLIPFTRASRTKSRLAFQTGPTTLNAATQALAPIQLPAAGFLRSIRLSVTVTSSGNAAAVAFNNDGPFNVLQQVSLLSANGDSIVSPIDGFTLYAINKYMAIGTGRVDPVADTGYSLTTGAVGAGGSATFNLRIPLELDTRDAFGALPNMAANQSFLLNLSLASLSQLFTTAPTAAPTVSITGVMEYWSAPAQANANGDAQAQAPLGAGTVSLIQTQTPPINPGTQQNIQLLNVGNTIRVPLLILRNASGVRTEADFPNVSNWYVNNDPWYYKTKTNWRSQLGQAYRLTAPTATPTAGALDNGVFPLVDFIDEGAAGNLTVNGGENRNRWLVTGSATAFNFEAVSWGASASSLLIVQNTVRPSSPQAVYAPQMV